ncbi:MAG: 5-oxoprolinase subunit PxpA [Pseudomonadota bacterium]
MTTIDLNADLGESFGPWKMGDDEAMLEIVSSANIACGFHASDPAEMTRVVRLAKAAGVGIGAHPGFQDLQGFGRRRIFGMSNSEIEALVIYQIGALQAIAASEGATLQHVKAHGALNNMACGSPKIAHACINAARRCAPDLINLVLPNTALENAATEIGVSMAREVFADRAYNDDGSLVARGTEGAMIHDPDAAAANVLAMIEQQAITSINGVKIPVAIDTVCVHGDAPTAVAMARHLRRKLEDAGVTITKLSA